MLRYVALCWNPNDPLAASQAGALARRLTESSQQWHDALDLPGAGVRVLYVADRTNVYRLHTLPNAAGVVLGALFDKTCESRGSYDASLSAAAAGQILSSCGRSLVRDYWGHYVAILVGHAAPRILRAPMGTLPCYLARHNEVQIAFSDCWDLWTLGLAPPDINWRYIDAHILQFGPDCQETGLVGIDELRPAECVTLAGREPSRTFYWNPLDIAEQDPIEDPKDAAARLRDTTRACVHAWSAPHSSILHSLSGGLDSTIVLSCLVGAPTNPLLTCVNHYSAGSNTDERGYARLAARHARCRLIEHHRSSEVSWGELATLRPRAPKPSFFIGLLESGRTQNQYAQACGASIICSGTGGDQLFYLARAIHSVGDYIRRHGFGSELFTIAYNAARLERKSIWHVLRKGFLDGVLNRPWYPREEAANVRRQLLSLDSPARLQAAGFGVHPWLREARRVCNGKRYHAYTLGTVPFFYNPLGSDDDPQNIYPLLSQPLIELALRIPTYTLTHGGWDRSVARAAFADDIPKEIAWRRTKGGLEEHARAMLNKNASFVRELVLDGVLTRNGYLDRGSLERSLSAGPSANMATNAELFEIVSLEAWLNGMTQPQRYAAAA